MSPGIRRSFALANEWSTEIRYRRVLGDDERLFSEGGPSILFMAQIRALHTGSFFKIRGTHDPLIDKLGHLLELYHDERPKARIALYRQNPGPLPPADH